MQTVELARPIGTGDRIEEGQQTKRRISDPPQIKALTGLRFLPLIIICWHHARDFWIPWKGAYEDALAFKHFVTLFFVLSGFILTYRYNYVKNVGSSLHFYVARLARLWPMHLFCLFLLLRLMPEVFSIKGSWTPVFLCNLFMVQSWVPISKYYFSYNAPSWSSATLSFFDLAFPFLFIWAQRSKVLVMAVPALFVLGMIGLCNYWNLPIDSQNGPSIHGMTYISGWTRLLEFATGVVAALTYLRFHERMTKLPRLAGTAIELAAIALLVFVNLNSKSWMIASEPYITKAGAFWLHNSGDCFIPLAIFITILAMERGVVSKFFASKPMAVLGDMSFALYMLHAVFIAYFNTHFHDELTAVPAIFFFSSLLVAAHIMHTSIVQPMRFQFLKLGTRLLELKWPSPTKPPSKPKDPAKLKKKRIILAVEVVACVTLLYFAFPTIHRISAAQAQTLSAAATTHDVQFPPWLVCKSGSARADVTHGKVIVETVWQACKKESVDFYITAKLLNKDGSAIAVSRYQMDGRFQQAAPGELWSDAVHVYYYQKNVPDRVAISVTRGKHKELAPQSALAAQVTAQEMIVPIIQ